MLTSRGNILGHPWKEGGVNFEMANLGVVLWQKKVCAVGTQTQRVSAPPPSPPPPPPPRDGSRGGYGGGLRGQDPTPKLHKRGEKTSRAWARMKRILVVNSYPEPPPPLSKILYLPLHPLPHIRGSQLLVVVCTWGFTVFFMSGGCRGLGYGIVQWLGAGKLAHFSVPHTLPLFIPRSRTVTRDVSHGCIT